MNIGLSIVAAIVIVAFLVYAFSREGTSPKPGLQPNTGEKFKYPPKPPVSDPPKPKHPKHPPLPEDQKI